MGADHAECPCRQISVHMALKPAIFTFYGGGQIRRVTISGKGVIWPTLATPAGIFCP